MGLGIQAYQMGGLGIFRYTAAISPEGDIKFAIYGMILDFVAIVAGFALAWVLGFDDDEPTVSLSKEEAKKQVSGQSKRISKEEITSPAKGEVLPLSQAKDPVFAEGVIGRGVIIEPTEGIIYAPFNGTVMTIFPTKHAIGLISENGMELLIHIGVDTVQLDGEFFETFITEGQQVKAGDKLASFDIKEIEVAGYSSQVLVINTNTLDYADIIVTDKKTVEKDNLLFTAVLTN